MSLFALVLTGPPGSGKTAVLQALQNALTDDDIKHAAIEVEALAWAHPLPSDKQSFRHLAAVRQLYSACGYDVLLCAATVTSDPYMQGLLSALAADERLIVRLEADVPTLHQRIIDREPPSWSGLPRLLDAAEKISAASRKLKEVDAAFSTTGAPPTEIAAQIRSMRPGVLIAVDIASPSSIRPS